ncbi:MAG: hypothetical protein ABSC23_09105 [Bryobacteraceae bacterium]|jgi:hypothetical protein
MRLGLIAACLPPLLAAQDPGEILRHAIEADAQNERISRNYTFLERDDQRKLDSAGQVKERKIATWDVTLLEGSPYRRLAARDDKPLSPDEQRKEDEKLRKSNEERRNETGEQRKLRIGEWEARRQKQRQDVRELPMAFDFHLAGDERLNGVDVWAIAGVPHPGYRARTAAARALLPKIDCRFWISKSDYGLAKMELETLDTVSRGLFFVRLSKGSRIVLEQTRVNGEVWLPRRVTVTAGARLLLVKGMRIDLQIDYSDYKKFQAESKIVGFQEKK